MMERFQIKSRIRDTLYGGCIGGVISLILAVLGGLIAVFTQNGDSILERLLQGSSAALFVGGSFGLFISAFFILKNKSKDKEKYKKDWRRKFHVFTYQGAILCISLVILLFGSVIDWIFYSFIRS